MADSVTLRSVGRSPTSGAENSRLDNRHEIRRSGRIHKNDRGRQVAARTKNRIFPQSHLVGRHSDAAMDRDLFRRLFSRWTILFLADGFLKEPPKWDGYP